MSTQSKKGRKMATRHSQETISSALIALGLESGNSRRAAARLAALDPPIKVNQRTIHRWMTTRAEEYEAIRRDLLPRLREQAAEAHHQLADRQLEAGIDITQRLHDSLSELEPRELPKGLQALSIAMGINRTKAGELRGEGPPAVAVNINIADTIRGLAAKGTPFFDAEGKRLSTEQALARAKGESIEGTAQEIDTPSSPPTDISNTDSS